MPLNKIMIVIDPTSDQQPAFERALESARLTGAQLHIYACVDQESGYANLEEAREKLQAGLDDLSSRAQADGMEATSELEHAPDWREAAVTAAARCGASMVFKNSFDHSAVQRELRATSDWTLLRMAPCPVLMVKNFHNWKHRRVLAAINPATTDDAHIKLNHQIVNVARSFTDAYGSDAHYVIAFRDLNNPPDADEVAHTCGTNRELVHIKQGKAADVIRDTARELEVDLIIVGTVGRDGIKGRTVGNTSERLLDQTQSDLLVLN
jgi:universal stress protein E